MLDRVAKDLIAKLAAAEQGESTARDALRGRSAEVAKLIAEQRIIEAVSHPLKRQESQKNRSAIFVTNGVGGSPAALIYQFRAGKKVTLPAMRWNRQRWTIQRLEL